MPPEKALLSKAEEWVKKAIEIENKPEYTQTHAAILRQQGKAQEALELLKKTKQLKKGLGQ